jgi:hypothetical protein
LKSEFFNSTPENKATDRGRQDGYHHIDSIQEFCSIPKPIKTVENGREINSEYIPARSGRFGIVIAFREHSFVVRH